MSLIDDALKRARDQDKAARARTSAPAAGSSTKDPWEYAPLPDRGRRQVPWPAAVLVILAAAVAGVLLFRPASRPVQAPVDHARPRVVRAAPLDAGPLDSGPGASAPTPAVPSARDAGESLPSSQTAAEASIAAAPPGSFTGTAAAVPSRADARVGESREIRRPPDAASLLPIASASASPRIRGSETVIFAKEASSPLRPAERASAGRTYVGSLVAPGGGRVELGGIVFSESPAALLNGRVLPVGGVVEGLTVARIEENRVELQGDGITVFLSLR